MKKEIGSIFPLSDELIRHAEAEHLLYTDNKSYYSLCREALYDIAIALDGTRKTVMIPAYTCQTVITPFEKAGWQCVYYSIKKDLRINLQSLEDACSQYRPSLLVVHPFFGMDLNEEEIAAINGVKEKGVEIILDLTQCLFSSKQYSFASFIVASYRKWMPIPDGGFMLNYSDSVKITQPGSENVEFTSRNIAAMYLRGLYFSNGQQRIKDISIWLNHEANEISRNNCAPHKMSQVAYNLLLKEDVENNQKRRYDNYAFLFRNVKESIRITKVCRNMTDVTTAPLYFTVFVQNRSELQSLLAQNSIYAPVIWPVEDEKVLINDEVIYIYNHILAIPCDQRYDEEDMLRAIEILNKY